MNIRSFAIISFIACSACAPSTTGEIQAAGSKPMVLDQRLYGGSLARIKIAKPTAKSPTAIGSDKNRSKGASSSVQKIDDDSEIKSEPIYIRVSTDGNHEVISEIKKEDKSWIRSKLKDSAPSSPKNRDAGKLSASPQEPSAAETKAQIKKLRTILESTEEMIEELERTN